MNIAKNPILVLNKGWIPVRVSSFKKALSKVCADRARFVDHESYGAYSWKSWLDNFSMPHSEIASCSGPVIKGVNVSICQPEIIVCSIYNTIPKNNLKLTRRNLLVRDNFTCQYCGCRVTSRDATIDHVLPRSRGGLNLWENLVISCIDCNVGKANKTPQEAGLRLLSKVKKPSWNPLYALLSSKRPASWSKFINTSKWNNVGYWDVELQD